MSLVRYQACVNTSGICGGMVDCFPCNFVFGVRKRKDIRFLDDIVFTFV